MTLARNLPDLPQVPSQFEPPEIPEHIVVLLLEGAQRLVARLKEAIAAGDPRLLNHFTRKALAVIDELDHRLNHEEGGELVNNLARLYDWWRQEILLAGEQGGIDRLQCIQAQMGDIRQAWEHVLFEGEGMSESPDL